MARVLIIGCGNPLRSDDGLAWHAAEQLGQALTAEEAQIVCVHQLTPELAESASHADAVIFLDAACDGEPGSVIRRPLVVRPAPTSFSHQLTPEGILALCAKLYGATPKAFAVSLGGESFAHGEALSPTINNALPEFVAEVKQLLRELA